MDASKNPNSCPEVDELLSNARNELQNLTRQESTVIGNIEKLNLQLLDIRRAISANQFILESVPNSITAYRQYLIHLDKEHDKDQKSKE
jgi:CII-binding regulator of phage lambda lysogenization HflD